MADSSITTYLRGIGSFSKQDDSRTYSKLIHRPSRRRRCVGIRPRSRHKFKRISLQRKVVVERVSPGEESVRSPESGVLPSQSGVRSLKVRDDGQTRLKNA